MFLKGDRCYSDKCAFDRKDYPPGKHGQRRRGKISDYGIQLREKQKVKRMYGLLENQFRGVFKKADQKSAQEIQQKLAYIVKAYYEKPFPGKVKELINQLGRPVGKSRNPVLEPTPEEKAYIRESLKRAGLI